MRRRDLLGAALGGATLAACGSSGGAPAVHTGERVRWRLTSSFPRSLDTIFGGAEVLAERVSAMTGGAFEIRVHPAGEIVPGLEVLDAVQQGTVEIGQTASYYYIGKNPALAFDTCVPFGLTSRQQTAWLLEGGGAEAMAPLFADFGIVCLPAGNTGVQMGGWFVPEVPSLSALAGLKMRIPGMGGKVMEALGVVPQTIAGGEIYPALERGAIDATDWVGPYDDEQLGFHKIAKNYYHPGWWEPGPALSYYVGASAWAGLSAEYQAILRTAAIESAVVMQARYDARNPPALARLVAAGVQLRPFTADVMAAASTASTALLEDLAASDATFKALYEKWSAFRKDSVRWFGVAELAYHDFVWK